MRISCLFILIASIFLSAVPVGAQERKNADQALQEKGELFLEMVAAGEETERDASELVDFLTAVVKNGEHQRANLAIRALARLKSKAAPAISVLCGKLDDSSPATRDFAAAALVAIGHESAPPLRALLDAKSARCRAAATEGLVRLRSIHFNELAALIDDCDPRVRASAVHGLANVGEPGVALLVQRLDDPEIAVAVAAADGLGSNRSDSSLAIPGLTKALARSGLGVAVADALARYGIEARKVVPDLLKHYPLLCSYRDSTYAVTHALEHIGPPDKSDLSSLSGYLMDRNEDLQFLTAQTIAKLGTQGQSAATDIKAAIDTTLKRYVSHVKSFPTAEDDDSGRQAVALEELMSAYWMVTYDTPGFLQLVDTVSQADALFGRWSYESSPWRRFSTDDWRLVEKSFRTGNRSMQQCILQVTEDAGSSAEPMKELLLELAEVGDAEISLQAVKGLAAIGPSVAEESAPVLLRRVSDGTLPLQDFASAIQSLGIRSAEIEAVQERGLQNKDRWVAESCARSLCKTADDPERIAALVIEAARKHPLDHRSAIEALRLLHGAREIVLNYLIEQAGSGDFWTQHDALSGLGSLGADAKSALPILKSQMEDSSRIENRLAAAKSIFQISGDRSYLDKALNSIFSGDERQYRAEAINTIAELGRDGSPFLDYIVTQLSAELDEYYVSSLFEALKAIGTADAIDVLQKTSESHDWLLRSQASTALAELRSSVEKGGD